MRTMKHPPPYNPHTLKALLIDGVSEEYLANEFFRVRVSQVRPLLHRSPFKAYAEIVKTKKGAKTIYHYQEDRKPIDPNRPFTVIRSMKDI